MSYYGIKKQKVVKNEDGYNLACYYYDSSVRDYDGNRVWHYTDNLFRKNYTTKEELERVLFEDVLDGNIHGASGKFACINWENNKVTLSGEDLQILQKAENEKNKAVKNVDEVYNEIRYKYNDYDNLKEDWRYFEAKKKSDELRESYTKLRYDLYYKAWKKYLEEEKAMKKSRRKGIIEVDYDGIGKVYVSSLGTKTVLFSVHREKAKVVNKTQREVEQLLKGFKNISNPILVELT